MGKLMPIYAWPKSLLRRGRSFARVTKRFVVRSWQYRSVARAEMFPFRCNICGRRSSFPKCEMAREQGDCLYCGSTVRWRSIVHALSMEIFGVSLVLADFPVRKDIQGIGLSDWTGYAEGLARKFTYTNTFYHCEPRLDIANPSPFEHGKYDFLISSDVFEHVPPPIASAFEGAFKLLKPDGVMIFTVPYVDGLTKEHFPDLHRFSIEMRDGAAIILNETADGRNEQFKGVTLHGGPGSTVEMRLFGKESLVKNVSDAGFEPPVEYSAEAPDLGILWLNYDAEKAPYRPFIYGLDTPPWALRRPKEVSPADTQSY